MPHSKVPGNRESGFGSIHASTRRRVRRWNSLLWGMALLLIVLFAGAILVLQAVATDGQLFSGGRAGSSQYVLGIALVGLSLLFCLYTLLKHLEHSRILRALEDEEREVDAMRLRLAELSALYEKSSTADVAFPLQELLDFMVQRLVAVLKAHQASIMILDSHTHTLRTRAAYGLDVEYTRNATSELGQGIAGMVAVRKKPVLLPAEPHSPEIKARYQKGRDISSAMCIPLVAGGDCVGVININRVRDQEDFQEHHLEILGLFAPHIASLIARAQLLEDLSRKANELERELETANRALEKTNRARDTFLETAAHELKTPLTVLVGYAEILETQGDALPPAEKADFLRRICSEGARLSMLVDEIGALTAGREDGITLDLAPHPLNEVVAGAVGFLRDVSARHQVRLLERYEDVGDVEVDADRIRQGLVSIISSSLRFSPREGSVKIRTYREGDAAVIEVSDQSQGASHGDTSQILAPFGYGRRSSEHSLSGMGLGLPLAKRIIELHRGELQALSVPGVGSAFRITLPRGDSAAGSSASRVA